MQCIFEQRGRQNYIVNTAGDGPDLDLRVLTEEEIQNINLETLKLYRRKIQDVRPMIHKSGTPQAVKAIDHLFRTTNRTLDNRVVMLKVKEGQKIAMVRTLRAYGERVKSAMGFGTWEDRQNLRVTLFQKEDRTEEEDSMLQLLVRIDSVNGLKFAKEYAEQLVKDGELQYGDEAIEPEPDYAQVML